MTESQQLRVIRSLKQLIEMAESINNYYGGPPPNWPHRIAIAKRILAEITLESPFADWEIE